MKILLSSVSVLALSLMASAGHGQTVSVPAGTNLTTLPAPTSTTVWNLQGDASLSHSPSALTEFTPPTGTPGLTINGVPSGSTITLNDGSAHFGRFSNLSVSAPNSIVLNLSNVTLTGGNSGSAFNSSGGAIAALTGGSVTINGSLNANHISAPNNPANPAGANGGVIIGNGVTVTGGVNFDHNSAGQDAGVIAAGPGDISLAATSGNVIITNNTAGRDAGALAGVNVSIGNANSVVDIEHNTATTGSGGAISATNVLITGRSITLSSNAASPTVGFGGAINALGSVRFSGDTTANNNSAGGNGGVVYSSAGNITVGGATSMSNNSAGGAGGALRAAGGDIVLSATSGNVLLAGNTAGTDGGALGAFAGNVFVGNSTGGVDIEHNTATAGAGGAINAAGNVTINGAGTISSNSAGGAGGAIWAGGNVTLNATSANMTFSGNTQGTATTPQANAIWMDNTGGSATLTLNAASGKTLSFFDPIDSNLANGQVNVVVNGGGTVEIDGSRHTSATDRASLIFANTVVSNGIFRVDNGAVWGTSSSRLAVLSGGTLGGNGTVAGSVTNGGTVRPGGSIGTLTVGSYTQTANGTLAIEVSPTASSQLNSLGAASLNGTLALNFDPGPYTSNIYTFVNGHPVTGTFSNVTAAGFPLTGAVFGVAYGPTGVFLVTAPTGNAQVYGAVQSATIGRAQSFASLVEDRLGDAACPDGSVDKATPACAGDSVWAYGFGSWSDHGHDRGVFGYTNDGFGVVAGVDHTWVGGSSVGGAFGYSDNDLKMDAVTSKATGASYYGAVYGRLVDGPTWWDGQLFYMHTGWTVNRAIAGFGVAASSPGTDSEGALLQVSSPIGATGLRPYGRITYVVSRRSGAFEQGVGLLDFAIVSDRSSAAVGEVGLLYEPTFTTGNIILRPALQLGVQDNFGDRGQTVLGSLGRLAGTAFAQAAPGFGGVAGVVDGSVKVEVSKAFELFGDLRGRFGDHQTDGLASIGGVFRF